MARITANADIILCWLTCRKEAWASQSHSGPPYPHRLTFGVKPGFSSRRRHRRTAVPVLPASWSYHAASRQMAQRARWASEVSKSLPSKSGEMSGCSPFRESCPYLCWVVNGIKLFFIWFLSRHVDSDQAEVRSAALDAVESCYIGLDMDSARIHRLLGAVNDKTKTLIDEVGSSEICFVQLCRIIRLIFHSNVLRFRISKYAFLPQKLHIALFVSLRT